MMDVKQQQQHKQQQHKQQQHKQQQQGGKNVKTAGGAGTNQLLILFVCGIGLLLLNSKDIQIYKQYYNSSNSNKRSTITINTETNNNNNNDNENNNTNEKKIKDECWYHLDPPWGIGIGGSGGTTGNGNSSTSSVGLNNNQKHVCAIRRPGKIKDDKMKYLYPFTTATTLTKTCTTTITSFEGNNNNKTATTTTTIIDDDDKNDKNDDDDRLLLLPSNDHNDNDIQLTIIILYYCNPNLLLKQIDNFLTNFPSTIMSKIQILILDDGSPPGLQAKEYITTLTTSTSSQLLNLHIIRIIDNIPWNMPMTQNLGFFLSQNSNRVLLLDLDTFIPNVDVLKLIMNIPLITKITTTTTNAAQSQQHIAYQIMIGDPPSTTNNATHQTQVEKDDNKRTKHPKIMLISSDLYWNVGGYDEGFCGHYGHTDYSFWYRFGLHPYALRRTHPQLYVKMIDNDSNNIDKCSVTVTTGNGNNNNNNDTTTTTTTANTNTNNATKTITNNTNSSSSITSSSSSSTTLTLYEQCTMALQLLPKPPKRSDIPINKKLFQRRKLSGCWSNIYLQNEWIIDL